VKEPDGSILFRTVVEGTVTEIERLIKNGNFICNFESLETLKITILYF